MNLKLLRWILGYLLILKFQVKISCDYFSIMKCGLQKDCWPNLDMEMVTVIHDNIKHESSPCNSFWSYACGSWKSPYEQHNRDNFEFVMENYVNRMQKLLLTVEQKTETNLLKNLGTYYQSCISINLKQADLRHYLDELPITTRGIWSTLIENTSQNSNFDWLQTIAELRLYGLNGVFFEEHATVAFNDSTKNAIELKMPDDKQSFEKKFELVNYFVEFGLVDGVTDHLWDLATQIFELEQQLKELRTKHCNEDENDDTNFEEALTLRELKEKIPNIDFQSYFNILLGQAHASSSIPIEVNGIGYLRELPLLLAQTDDSIIAFYILMQLCKYIFEIRPQISAKNCLDHMSTVMPLGLNYIYDRFIYETRRDDEKILNTIFNQLKLQFQKYLQSNKLLLNQAELNFLKRKLNKMILRLGNLSSNVSIDYIEQHYTEVNITANFYSNHWKMLCFRTKQQHFGFLHNEAHINLQTFYVYDDINQMRNAPYFVHERNLLIVPMIFMQLPFFHHELHPLLQYSLVGFILAHELNHAFENEGIIMDADGNESSVGFSIKRKKEFISNVRCFQITETASLVERMADVNGFQLAFDAYFGNYGDNSTENSIEDFLNSSLEKQLFFLNFAQFFCGELPIAIDHDSDDVRVNEIVKNMPEFRRAFQCNDGKLILKRSDMCEMWRS